ncbi:hypothetical protein PHYSODRAFT_475297 [Phytophthora sojae]|uniref:Ubiquitin-like protease family profile domain-containing protein n=1 Tax=Phytophthora sojae (strain P6497) TaxID=1094619 RepID=G4YGD4_PHYSP|nr:hypothetical protein PHYSODRAFT_475297 [Phytophthora sojae]EGZ29047.1 hypothetical protein PHYSODRAFT_475297 [Phytophthora sojae]|eukprot:XP_009516322.1 hypothetical protein PHYSODRAFT_475297 [Phytophthora sojae]
MQAVKRTKEKAARDERLAGHIGKFDWVSYRFVILPVNGNSHWSFLVVENPLQGGVIRLYHVNSVTEAHDTANVFSLMQCFHACPTKPQQQNSVDCGIYLLYFIEKISTAIMKDRPHTLRGSMDKLCSDKFNVENYRALLHQRIIRAANVANKKSKIL